METPGQFAARLLASLEDLVALEGMYLRGGYYDLAVETRERAAPLVSQLVALCGQPGVSSLGPRVDAIVAQGAAHADYLREKMDALAAEIRRTDQARLRAAQIAPVYANPPGAGLPRFSAAG